MVYIYKTLKKYGCHDKESNSRFEIAVVESRQSRLLYTVFEADTIISRHHSIITRLITYYLTNIHKDIQSTKLMNVKKNVKKKS